MCSCNLTTRKYYIEIGQGAYDVIEMNMTNVEEILMGSPRRAAPDVEGGVKAGDHHACLVSSHGNPLDEVALDIHTLSIDLRPHPPVPLLLRHGPVNHR